MTRKGGNKMRYRQQGDILIFEVSEFPKGLKIKHITQEGHVLALGETTNHKHAILDEEVEVYEDAKGTLWIKTEKPVEVTHEEHRAVTVPPGTWRVGRVQEFDPFLEEARNIAD